MTLENDKNSLLGIKISMFTAFFSGVLNPILETIRRWHQMSDLNNFMFWFDDYLIGGFLFFAAWRTFKSINKGYKLLIAAWGCATGLMFYSFVGQIQMLDKPDPAPVSSLTVAFIKGVMFLIIILCLILSVRHKENSYVDSNSN